MQLDPVYFIIRAQEISQHAEFYELFKRPASNDVYSEWPKDYCVIVHHCLLLNFLTIFLTIQLSVHLLQMSIFGYLSTLFSLPFSMIS